MQFQVGDAVNWSSQANGHWSVKRGLITEVVPANTLPQLHVGFYSQQFALHKPRYKLGNGGARNHESYIVVIPGEDGRQATVYWPIASGLHMEDNDE